MTASLVLLIPIALAIGVVALLVFLWSMRNGQYEDLDGAGQRILIDDEQEGWQRPPLWKDTSRKETS